MKRITQKKLSSIIDKIDQENFFDFETFISLMQKADLNASIDTMENVIDYLVFDLNLNCDADLRENYQIKAKEILDGINAIGMLQRNIKNYY